LTTSDLKYAILALVAAVAGFLGMKAGRRGADKRVAKVADEAADKMKAEINGRIDEDLAEIDARPVTDDVVADLESRLSRGTRPHRGNDPRS
jgi:hypothetical protein